MRVVIVSVFMGIAKSHWLPVAHSMVSKKEIVFSYSESDHGIQVVPMRR